MRKGSWLTLIGISCFALAVFGGPGPSPVSPLAPETPTIVLPAAEQTTPDRVQAVFAQNLQGQPLQAVGLERALEQPISVEFTSAALPEGPPVAFQGGTLERTPEGGLIWTAHLAIADAMAVGLHLKGLNLPSGTILSVSARGGQGRQTFGSEKDLTSEDLWSPFVRGSLISLRAEFPASVTVSGGFEIVGMVEILKPRQVAGPPSPPPIQLNTPEPLAPTAVPSPPSSLTATSVGPNSILLNWVRTSTNEKGFKVQRQNGNTGKWKLVSKVGIGVTTFTDATVTPGLMYTYRVKAFNLAGVSGPSNTATVVAGVPGTLTLTATAQCNGNNPRNHLAWTASLGATSYDLYKNSVLLVAGLSGSPYEDDAVTAGQNYAYKVTAKNAYGTADSNTSGATAQSNCCPLPGSATLSASPGCTGTVPRVALSWTAATNTTSYDINRNGVSYVAGQTGTSYTDNGVTAGQAYNYQVISKSVCGTAQSNVAPATAPSTCCPAPGSFALTLTPFCYLGTAGYTLHWTVASGVSSTSSYDIYKDGVLAYAAKDQSITWFDAAPVGSTHAYYIQAYNGCGTTNSNTATAVAPASCAYTVIVDDLDSGFVATVNDPVYPHWGEVYAAYPACWNGHQYFAANQAAYTNWAFWWANLAVGGAGNYSISVYVPNTGGTLTHHAWYTIWHGGTKTADVYLDQSNYYGSWATLGTFYCYGDGFDIVGLYDVTGEAALTTYVDFDAIRWVKQ